MTSARGVVEIRKLGGSISGCISGRCSGDAMQGNSDVVGNTEIDNRTLITNFHSYDFYNMDMH